MEEKKKEMEEEMRGEEIGAGNVSVDAGAAEDLNEGIKGLSHARGYDVEQMIEENERRKRALAEAEECYDPIAGRGSVMADKRVDRSAVKYGEGRVMIPHSMLTDPDYRRIKNKSEWVKVRCRHDFEYWAEKCVVIKDKTSGVDIPFRLNRPQRRVLEVLERQRVAGDPIRLILLKARQWGGSTLVQMYMAWIQTCLRRNWNSVVCAHVKDAAATIRGMYAKMLSCYPEKYWEGDEAPQFKPFERTNNIRLIAGRGCKVTLGSSENQDAVRGADYAMAHLTEVAFWKDTPQSSPTDFVRAICGAINATPLTLVAIESTANGVGNYFHREWLRAEAGDSDKAPVFVPWHEIDIYSRQVDDAAALISSMDQYEWGLWAEGVTLEQIAWYHYKRREYPDHASMQAEYPSNPVEAFAANDCSVFASADVERLRPGCRQPLSIGDISGREASGPKALEEIRFAPSPLGSMKIWSEPEESGGSGRYVVTVDVGGRSRQSDWSVIAVFDRRGGPDGTMPEVAAQWRGHIDHDLLAWKSAQIATYYCGALLVFESNTFETDNIEGDPSAYVLAQVRHRYPHLYYRAPDAEGGTPRIGFHTNRSTKTTIISRLIAAVRDIAYIERDSDAINELLTYEVAPNGSYAARKGCHDDILMTRAIALQIIANLPASGSEADLIPFLRRYRK